MSWLRPLVILGLARHFDYLLVEGEFGIGEADERVSRHVLAELGTTPDRAVTIGDDLERDVAGPRRVGMMGVWIDRAASGRPPRGAIRPDRIIGSLSALLA